MEKHVSMSLTYDVNDDDFDGDDDDDAFLRESTGWCDDQYLTPARVACAEEHVHAED